MNFDETLEQIIGHGHLAIGDTLSEAMREEVTRRLDQRLHWWRPRGPLVADGRPRLAPALSLCSHQTVRMNEIKDNGWPSSISPERFRIAIRRVVSRGLDSLLRRIERVDPAILAAHWAIVRVERLDEPKSLKLGWTITLDLVLDGGRVRFLDREDES